MARQVIEFGRYHPHAPILSLPADFYPERLRLESYIAKPQDFLQIKLNPAAASPTWVIEPTYDVTKKKYYRAPFDNFFFLVVSYASGYYDVFAKEDEDRDERQPVFYETEVYDLTRGKLRKIEEEGPVVELRRMDQYVAIPVPWPQELEKNHGKAERIILAERSAVENDPQHFLDALTTPR